eukprot:TRINITY_DN66736_c5_g9_i2.p1 TRINITY_DN66736_c5_g9~~TRINITY_DN66736_c5_g9_i2.p1  ORF type:complete len:148 (+),score=41.77 TRINITY_DN66736_c5_g9_i2:27-470(+)
MKIEREGFISVTVSPGKTTTVSLAGGWLLRLSAAVLLADKAKSGRRWSRLLAQQQQQQRGSESGWAALAVLGQESASAAQAGMDLFFAGDEVRLRVTGEVAVQVSGYASRQGAPNAAAATASASASASSASSSSSSANGWTSSKRTW